jgi:hypothetical protein
MNKTRATQRRGVSGCGIDLLMASTKQLFAQEGFMV